MSCNVVNEQAAKAEKTNLLGLSREKMAEFFVSIGEKPFRAQQMLKWIHHAGVDDYQPKNCQSLHCGKLGATYCLDYTRLGHCRRC